MLLIFTSTSSLFHENTFVYRVGSIFILETVGLRTFGRARQMERGDFIQGMVASFLAILKMAGVMGNPYI